MQAAGHSPIAVVDGVGALATMELPDLIVADFNLPNGPNGGEVVAMLREKLERQIPAVVLTGDISTQTLRAMAGLGCAESRQAGGGGGTAAPRRASSRNGDAAKAGEPLRKPVVRDSLRCRRRRWSARDGWRDARSARLARRDLCELRGLPRRVGWSAWGAWSVDDGPAWIGFELLARLKADKIVLPSIMITGHGDVSMAVKAMQAGACDFLEKPFRHDELISSIKLAQEKSQDSSPPSRRRADAAAHLSSLTTRQRQILDLVLAGHPSKNIAADLCISQRTVENHRAAIMRKTGSRSIPALIRLVVGAV